MTISDERGFVKIDSDEEDLDSGQSKIDQTENYDPDKTSESGEKGGKSSPQGNQPDQMEGEDSLESDDSQVKRSDDSQGSDGDS